MSLIPGKCPNCGANLKINDTAKGELTCPFCGGTYLVENAVSIINNETINNNNFAGANVIINQTAKDAYIKQYLENARRAINDLNSEMPIDIVAIDNTVTILAKTSFLIPACT